MSNENAVIYMVWMNHYCDIHIHAFTYEGPSLNGIQTLGVQNFI